MRAGIIEEETGGSARRFLHLGGLALLVAGGLWVAWKGREKIAAKPHPLHWVVEPLMHEVSYREQAMFGCRGCYVHSKLVVVLAARTQPAWQGVLFPTERAHQASLLEEFPALQVHPVIGKWLYAPEAMEEFEEVTAAVVARIARQDARLGVVSEARRKSPSA